MGKKKTGQKPVVRDIHLRSTTTNNEARHYFDLTHVEYALADAIFQLGREQNNSQGWSFYSNPEYAKFLRVSKRTIPNLLKKLVEKELIEVTPKLQQFHIGDYQCKRLGRRTTSKWFNEVVNFKLPTPILSMQPTRQTETNQDTDTPKSTMQKLQGQTNSPCKNCKVESTTMQNLQGQNDSTMQKLQGRKAPCKNCKVNNIADNQIITKELGEKKPVSGETSAAEISPSYYASNKKYNTSTSKNNTVLNTSVLLEEKIEEKTTPQNFEVKNLEKNEKSFEAAKKRSWNLSGAIKKDCVATWMDWRTAQVHLHRVNYTFNPKEAGQLTNLVKELWKQDTKDNGDQQAPAETCPTILQGFLDTLPQRWMIRTDLTTALLSSAINEIWSAKRDEADYKTSEVEAVLSCYGKFRQKQKMNLDYQADLKERKQAFELLCKLTQSYKAKKNEAPTIEQLKKSICSFFDCIHKHLSGPEGFWAEKSTTLDFVNRHYQKLVAEIHQAIKNPKTQKQQNNATYKRQTTSNASGRFITAEQQATRPKYRL